MHNAVSSRSALVTKQNGIIEIECSQPHAKTPIAKQANSAAGSPRTRSCCPGRSEPASDVRGSQTEANPAPNAAAVEIAGRMDALFAVDAEAREAAISNPAPSREKLHSGSTLECTAFSTF